MSNTTNNSKLEVDTNKRKLDENTEASIKKNKLDEKQVEIVEVWNYGAPIQLLELRPIYKNIKILDNKGTKYFALPNEKGEYVKTLNITFQSRSPYSAIQYFAPSKQIPLEGFCCNIPLTDEEVEFIKNEFEPWILDQIANNLKFYFTTEASMAVYDDKTAEQIRKTLKKMQTKTFLLEEPMKDKEKKVIEGKFYPPSYKGNIRKDKDMLDGKDEGSGYPSVAIYDLTTPGPEPEVKFFHPSQLTKEQKKDTVKKENYQKRREAIALMKQKLPDAKEICKICPIKSTLDYSACFLGISVVASNWSISNSITQIAIQNKSKSNYLKKEIGDAPKSHFVKQQNVVSVAEGLRMEDDSMED